MEKWIKMLKTAQTYEGIRDLIIKEQVIVTCVQEIQVPTSKRKLPEIWMKWQRSEKST